MPTAGSAWWTKYIFLTFELGVLAVFAVTYLFIKLETLIELLSKVDSNLTERALGLLSGARFSTFLPNSGTENISAPVTLEPSLNIWSPNFLTWSWSMVCDCVNSRAWTALPGWKRIL